MSSQISATKSESTNAYAPGFSAKDLSIHMCENKVINLASNESPHHLNEFVLNHIRQSIKSINRYPDNDCIKLKQTIAEHIGVNSDSVFLGNGSSEVLFSIGKCLLDSDSDVIYSQYSFIVYKMIAEAMGSRSIVTPAKKWGHDLDVILSKITSSTRVIFIANPNNPTGTWLETKELAAFIRRVPDYVTIVVDEAYFEFTNHLNYLDTTHLVNNHKNLIVTRTFSKAYGLAGIRLGYAIANPSLINILNKTKLPYSINSLALIAGEAAIQDIQYLKNHIASNNKQKNRLYDEFDKLGIEYIVSAANFVSFDAGQRFQSVYKTLAKNGILVRPLSNYGMPHHLRVTVGTNYEIDEFIKAIKSARHNKGITKLR